MSPGRLPRSSSVTCGRIHDDFPAPPRRSGLEAGGIRPERLEPRVAGEKVAIFRKYARGTGPWRPSPRARFASWRKTTDRWPLAPRLSASGPRSGPVPAAVPSCPSRPSRLRSARGPAARAGAAPARMRPRGSGGAVSATPTTPFAASITSHEPASAAATGSRRGARTPATAARAAGPTTGPRATRTPTPGPPRTAPGMPHDGISQLRLSRRCANDSSRSGRPLVAADKIASSDPGRPRHVT
jgi:hypothetical protein